jgi:hypothetical protein
MPEHFRHDGDFRDVFRQKSNALNAKCREY